MVGHRLIKAHIITVFITIASFVIVVIHPMLTGPRSHPIRIDKSYRVIESIIIGAVPTHLLRKRIHHVPPPYLRVIEPGSVIILPSATFPLFRRFRGTPKTVFSKNFTDPKIAVCLDCASGILRLERSSVTAKVASEGCGR